MALPKRKTHQLMEELNNASGLTIDEFSLNRIKFEAEKLRNSDPAYAYVVLGMVYTLKGNEAEMRNNFNTALSLDKSDKNILDNFATSLARFAHFVESAGYYRSAYDIESYDLKLLKYSMIYSFFGGNFNEVSNLISKYGKLTKNDFSAINYMCEALEIVEKHHIHSESCKELFGCIEMVMANYGPNIWLELYPQTYDDCVQFLFILNPYYINTEQLLDIEDAFCSCVEEKGIKSLLDYFNIAFGLENYNSSDADYKSDTTQFNENDIEIITEKDIQEIDFILK